MARIAPWLALLTVALLGAPALPLAPGAQDAPCDAPAGITPPGGTRVDAGPDAVVRIAFDVPQAATGTFAVWFGLRANVLDEGFPAERAVVAGFLERADGTRIATIAPNVAIFPYGVQADVGSAALRATAADGACWGGFGAQQERTLDAGAYQFVVLGASEAGSRFAAVLPAGAHITGTSSGPAQQLSAATMDCAVKARAFALGVLTEVLRGCDTPLHAEGRAYRSLVATWGPDSTHEVRWTLPGGGTARCYKAPSWCFDTGDGAPGDWHLVVPMYLTAHQPSPFLPVSQDGYSGIYGVFGGLP